MKRLNVFFIAALTLFLWSSIIYAQQITVEKKVYKAKRINPHPPIIDGKDTDECWKKAIWGSDFIQRIPNDGEDVSQNTEFKIMYDDENLYVTIRAFDSEPGKIERRLSRRDNMDGDAVTIHIDSYNDQRTAFSFAVNPANVKNDFLVIQEGQWDPNWNAVWYSETSLEEDAWVAELKIPFSQLRFGNAEEQVWGLQVERNLFRSQEISHWQYMPRNVEGYPRQFGELRGITGIKPKRQIEILPYSVSKMERFEKEDGNPFATGTDKGMVGGVDGKIGITNDLTLNFTVNPDFGQVEADPSEVNLSTFETFLEEKRPFFLEGSNITSFRVGTMGPVWRDNLFYSRRIGRRPHLSPDTEDGEYIDMPENSSILGAFKMTGKTKSGLSIGLMNSTTAQENAEIDLSGVRRKETVEPRTNYMIGRLQKDLDGGNTILGGIFTATNRNINTDELNFLHKSAYTGGLDFKQYWKDKAYSMTFNTIFSRVAGNSEAITKTQKASSRYFQRPDNTYTSFDTTRTSLSGHGGTFEIRKNDGHLRFASTLNWRSPGLEVNDLGYMRKADWIVENFWAHYQTWTPFSIFREMSVNIFHWSFWNFGGLKLDQGFNINYRALFKNHWAFNFGGGPRGEALSPTELRGGPILKRNGGHNIFFNIDSNRRKKLYFSAGGWKAWRKDSDYNSANFRFNATYRPNSALEFSINPHININDQRLQYVTTEEFAGEDRFILADIDQKSLGITFRLNYSVTPDLSIQYYGQPFVSAGKYTEFKKAADTRADSYFERFHQFSDSEINYKAEDDEYGIDEDGDGASDYSFENPDFNRREFNSNLVIRWEYSPGSTLFLVWSQYRDGDSDIGKLAYGNNMENLFRVHPHNVFLIKFNKWLSF